MTHVLPRSAPCEQRVDAAGIETFLDAVDSAPGVELHSLMVLRHGHVVAEGWWRPYTPERVHLLYSLSKSFASAAAGFAVAEGLLDLDATVLSYVPELDAEVTDPRSRAMRVRDVAAMASGHLGETADEAFAGEDPVLAFLRIAPDRDPGTVFAYNQPCTYTLAAIVQRLTGATLLDHLRPRLLEPLGIDRGAWQQHPPGRDIGYSGLHLTTEAVASFGQLLLDGGRRRGRQVLPPGWVEDATRQHVATADWAAGTDPGKPDWAQGYGLQFWRSRHGYRGDGAYGQLCLVLPEHDAVVVTTGASPDMQALLDAVWENLLSAFAEGPVAATPTEQRLSARLAALELPPVAPGAVPGAGTPWDASVLGMAPKAGLHGIRGAELRRAGANWSLALDARDGRLVAAVGIGDWTVTDDGRGGAPLAVCAGWDKRDAVRVDVAFLESPHRLRLTGDVSSRTLSATWHTEPLDDVSLVSMQRALGRTPAAGTAVSR